MSQTAIHVIGIDIGKNSFHIASVFGGWPAWLSIWIDLSLLLIVQTAGHAVHRRDFIAGIGGVTAWPFTPTRSRLAADAELAC